MKHTQKVFGFENAKTIKGESLGYITAIRYLAPADESGEFNVCPNAGACASVCLYTAGRGIFKQTQDARIAKTIWRMTDKADHMLAAIDEIAAAHKRATLVNSKLAVRVNDAVQLAKAFPAIQFYDYTKNLKSVGQLVGGKLPSNYHLTLSYDPETVTFDDALPFLKDNRVNLAVCFKTKRNDDLPAFWNGVRVIDGDDHDLRFLDPKGVIVGLRAKGAARNTPGFAVEV
jgi:hypothetical protein